MLGWTFAGTLGSQNVYECRVCGALCVESGRLLHSARHEEEERGETPLFRMTPQALPVGD